MAADDCDLSKNDNDHVNPDCNQAGLCFDPGSGAKCFCCNFIEEGDYCEGKVPGVWTGTTCDQETFFTQVTWGYIFEGSEVTCSNDGVTAASPDLLSQVTDYISDKYNGIVITQPCEICTSDNPCEYFDEGPVADSGVMVSFGTDINTYYDHSCAYDGLPESIRQCEENKDGGAMGFVKIIEALDRDNDFNRSFVVLQALVESSDGNGLGWTSTTLTRVWSQDIQILSQNIQTTRLPTPAPTAVPWGVATEEPLVCEEYVNSIDDLHFLGVGSSCRANINDSWPGGQSCESPYIVCLPQENTPSNDKMGNPYKSTDYRYTVDECLLECSYDQRCLGVEFVADIDSAVGDCNLIDDIPVAIENEVNGYSYNSADTDLDSSTTFGDALCWKKDNYCNPYFEAEDLNDDMLNCYCPNNRKGFYTKKVKRTVNSTRYCGSDAEADERIRKAQANRMFHLCENWCLFNTENPEGESFYWDPWKMCWRETYSGTGEHRSYCDRVIRNPYSIEMKFVSARSELYCGASPMPSSAPIADPYVWVLSGNEESCDDACEGSSYTCAEEATAQTMTETELKNAFAQAGVTCADEYLTMVDTSFQGFALPGLRESQYCIARQATIDHLENLDTDCSREIGVGWQRLCACYQ